MASMLFTTKNIETIVRKLFVNSQALHSRYWFIWIYFKGNKQH